MTPRDWRHDAVTNVTGDRLPDPRSASAAGGAARSGKLDGGLERGSTGVAKKKKKKKMGM